MPESPETQDAFVLTGFGANAAFGTPFKPAISARARNSPRVVLHVCYLDTDLTPIPAAPSTLSTMYRLYPLGLSRTSNWTWTGCVP